MLFLNRLPGAVGSALASYAGDPGSIPGGGTGKRQSVERRSLLVSKGRWSGGTLPRAQARIRKPEIRGSALQFFKKRVVLSIIEV